MRAPCPPPAASLARETEGQAALLGRGVCGRSCRGPGRAEARPSLTNFPPGRRPHWASSVHLPEVPGAGVDMRRKGTEGLGPTFAPETPYRGRKR